jgi:hypothetical protein
MIFSKTDESSYSNVVTAVFAEAETEACDRLILQGQHPVRSPPKEESLYALEVRALMGRHRLTAGVRKSARWYLADMRHITWNACLMPSMAILGQMMYHYLQYSSEAPSQVQVRD